MNYVHFSRLHNYIQLNEVQSKLGLKIGNVLRICDTRWVSHFQNCESTIKNKPAILKYSLLKYVEDVEA